MASSLEQYWWVKVVASTLEQYWRVKVVASSLEQYWRVKLWLAPWSSIGGN